MDMESKDSLYKAPLAIPPKNRNGIFRGDATDQPVGQIKKNNRIATTGHRRVETFLERDL